MLIYQSAFEKAEKAVGSSLNTLCEECKIGVVHA